MFISTHLKNPKPILRGRGVMLSPQKSSVGEFQLFLLCVLETWCVLNAPTQSGGLTDVSKILYEKREVAHASWQPFVYCFLLEQAASL